MRQFLVALVVAVVTAAAPASAHSLQELQTQLGDREQYFQPLDRPAPEFVLKDPDGRTVSLESLRGEVVVLHFIYTQCPDVCPLHAEKIAELQRMVNESAMRERVRFITITTDPVHDTPEVMRDYGPAHGLDPVNWTFLTSGPEEPEKTRDLAKQFGHVFTLTDDGFQIHGIVTHVIDREGRLRANFHGLKFEPTNLVVHINALTNDLHAKPHPDEPESLWDRLKALF
ncbi:MAG: SCO family protein [Hyphomicrobiales bacterium]|nr:SCO family protein [Hyphomicrobiales bacterium]